MLSIMGSRRKGVRRVELRGGCCGWDGNDMLGVYRENGISSPLLFMHVVLHVSVQSGSCDISDMQKKKPSSWKKISIHLHTPPQGIKQFEYPSSFSLLIQSIQKHKVIRPCRTKPPRCTSMHPSPTPEKRFPQAPIDDMGTQRLYKRVRYVNNVMWVGANVDVCGGRGVRD
jgi:hypothetical protein